MLEISVGLFVGSMIVVGAVYLMLIARAIEEEKQDKEE